MLRQQSIHPRRHLPPVKPSLNAYWAMDIGGLIDSTSIARQPYQRTPITAFGGGFNEMLTASALSNRLIP